MLQIKNHISYFIGFVSAALLLFDVLHAQTVDPSAPAAPGATSKVQARFDYFYQKQTFPNGVVPNGARMKAFDAMKAMRASARVKGVKSPQAYEWKNAGPFNVGGRILAVAVNPKNPNTIFIGSADGGVWRTWDEGRSWHSVSDQFPAMAMGSIVIDPIDTNNVYAGTGEASYAQRTFDGGGMLKSTDGGTTWRQVGASTLPGFARTSDMVIRPDQPSTLLIAAPDGMSDAAQAGIWKTTDGGETWKQVLDGMMADIVMNPKDPNVLYTVSSVTFSGGSTNRYGLWKSVDCGETWSHLSMGIRDTSMGRTSLAIGTSNPDILLAGVSEISGSGTTPLMALLKSTDAGASWTQLKVPFDYMVSQGWYDNIVGIDPVNPDIMFAGGVKLIRTSDGGGTWQRIPDQGYGGILHVDQHAIEFNPANPDRVYIGNDGGFYIISNQGADCVKQDYGLSITQFIGGAMHPTNDELLLGGTQDNGTLYSTSRPDFDLVLYGDGGNGAINPLKPNIMYTTQENLNFWRSEDFGLTWTRAMGGIPTQSSLFYIPLDMDMNNPSTLYLGTYSIFKTTNDGHSWTNVISCPFQTGASCYYVTALHVAPYDSRLVFAASNAGWIVVSQDAGATWFRRSDSLPSAYCSAVRSWRAGALYAVFSRYGVPKVWKSTDLGITWSNINGNLPDIPSNDIIELDGKLIIGTDLGPFISEDDGATWQPFGTGMPAVSVQKFVYSANTGTLRAMTHGRGMYDMQWKQMQAAAPVFTSLPDTTILQMGQPFIYVPVASGTPKPQLTLVSGPSSAQFDAAFGVVRWTGGDKAATFVLEATNASGTARQMFTLYTADVVSTDWVVVSHDAVPFSPQQLRCAGNNVLWLTCDTAQVGRSLDGGVTWDFHVLPGSRGSALGIHAFDADRAVVGTRGGEIFKTTDGGNQWRRVHYEQNARFGNIVFWDNDNGIAVTNGDSDSANVNFTTDGGETWTLSPNRRYFAKDPIDNTLRFFNRNLGWYATNNQGRTPPMDANIMRTTNGGMTWQIYSGSIRRVSGIGFVDNNNGFIIDDVSGAIKRSTNGGTNWRSVVFPMSGLRNSAIYSDTMSKYIWIVSDSAAWFSRDNGSTWTRTVMVASGPVQTAAFVDSTHGWAVMKYGVVQKLNSMPVVSVERTPGTIPGEVSISACYPNPMAAGQIEGNIAFRLNRAGHAVLKVHNSAGKVVATLVDAHMQAGEHFTTWDASEVPSGMYFFTITVGNETAVRRVAVLR